MPTVSIVTPAYRAAPFLGETVASVLAQTYGDFEMLVVDDRSPDGSADVALAAAGGDPRIRVLRHERNQGPAGARNTALAAATGRFIAFLDGDDLWRPEKLERHLAFMAARDAAVSCTQYRRIDADGRVISAVIDVPDRLGYRGLLGNTAMATSTVVVDRERTGPFVMREVFYDDYVCWLELLKRGFEAHGCHEDLTRYRIVEQSWSRNKARSAGQVWRVYRDVERLSWPTSAWMFVQYGWNAYRKYRR